MYAFLEEASNPGANPYDSPIYILADVDAALNATALVLIIAGLWAVKAGKIELHKKLMFAAAGVSVAFLACYLTYHALKPAPKTYEGEGVMKGIYYTILITHIVLAVVQVPLILRTIYLGVKDIRDKHRKLAKITAPIWLYVSFTGVIVWAMLYV